MDEIMELCDNVTISPIISHGVTKGYNYSMLNDDDDDDYVPPSLRAMVDEFQVVQVKIFDFSEWVCGRVLPTKYSGGPGNFVKLQL